MFNKKRNTTNTPHINALRTIANFRGRLANLSTIQATHWFCFRSKISDKVAYKKEIAIQEALQRQASLEIDNIISGINEGDIPAILKTQAF